MTFDTFFQTANQGSAKPYPYQRRFAESDVVPHLLRAPTGAGKTATAILGWAWRYFHSGQPTPRRLVYCLPMRVLVEQSFSEARRWLTNLGLLDQVGLHMLMGGMDADDWHRHPEMLALETRQRPPAVQSKRSRKMLRTVEAGGHKQRLCEGSRKARR